jgi:hypothetical protein
MLQFLQSRQWILARRLFLVGIVIVLGVRQYGNTVVNWLRQPNPTRDIVVTRAEVRPELPGAKPAWIIGFRNNSDKFTYDQIRLEAAYMDEQGKVIERDKLVVQQKLPPGDEKLIASVDFKSRGSAKTGTLTVVGAEAAK